MTIPKEIDNDECKAALRGIHAAGKMRLVDVLRGKYPMETGAILWHGLIEVTPGAEDSFIITTKGRQVLAWLQQ